jgi:two-component system, response regulator
MTERIHTGRAEPVEILLAEDEPSDADLCMRALQRRKVANHIVWVKDGCEALDFLFARGPYTRRTAADRPRLLLLDIKMPKVDGFEVLRQLRADPQFATMPVVMMTSSSEARDIAQGYRLGVNSFIHKPVEFANFQRAVEEVGLYWMLLNKAPER